MNKSTSDHYDLRGKAALGSPTAESTIAEYLVTPYDWVIKALKTKSVNEKSRFLDLCCGTGRNSLLPAQLGYQIDAVDISKVSIEAATALFARHNLSKSINLQIDDAVEYLAGQGEYDVIYVSGSLYYLKRPEILRMISDHLKPKGEFFCVETNGSNPIMNVIRKARQYIQKDRDQQTMDNLIRLGELPEWSQYFHSSRIVYFDFLCLLGPLFSWNKALLDLFLKVACPLDNFLLNKMGLKLLAFKFVFQGGK